jgi:hypothetical protein
MVPWSDLPEPPGRKPLLRRPSTRLIVLYGLSLIVLGGILLYLSDAVARTGSWSQSTLDAFGVGLVVGRADDLDPEPIPQPVERRRPGRVEIPRIGHHHIDLREAVAGGTGPKAKARHGPGNSGARDDRSTPPPYTDHLHTAGLTPPRARPQQSRQSVRQAAGLRPAAPPQVQPRHNVQSWPAR